MNGDHDPLDATVAVARRRTWLTFLLLALLFFVLGLGAMGWILSRWEGAAQLIGISPAVEVASVEQPLEAAPTEQPLDPATVLPAEPGTEPERIVIDPEITRRVSAIERRIAYIDTQSREAVGNADRAEGLLVAFAARRALDRGVPLGFLEALLRQRFGATQPQAVGTVIAAAREPVTLQELQDLLGELGPQLAGAGPQQSWWGAFRAELGSLITVRREGSPSPEPTERLRRATQRLEAGQVDVALAEVLRLPGREHARNWVTMARRYVFARRALDTIETAALLEPRIGQLEPTVRPPAAPQPARQHEPAARPPAASAPSPKQD